MENYRVRKSQNYIDLIKSFMVLDISAVLSILGYAIVNHNRIDDYQAKAGSVSFFTLVFLLLLQGVCFMILQRKMED